MVAKHSTNGKYQRYHIDTQPAADIVPWPSRFNVHVKKAGLAQLLLKELIHYRGKMGVILSRPCVYGVFSGPIGGFFPNDQRCVGCLRCTTEFPEFVRVEHNPERQKLGDSFFTFNYVDTVTYEAQTGMIPVKGAGYRGRFGGEGWDGMWTDMSEIVRPTRDGIHGREFISTVVDIGAKRQFITFDQDGNPQGEMPHTFQIPIPMLFDVPPSMLGSQKLHHIFAQAAEQVQSPVVLPLTVVIDSDFGGDHIVPLVLPGEEDLLRKLKYSPKLIEMDGWSQNFFTRIQKEFPDSLVALRMPFSSTEELLKYTEAGVRVFHLVADYHGRGLDGKFILELIREAHLTFVDAGIRDEVTLLGSGGMIAAEHIPKAIICGLDAVAIDTPAWVTMQAKFEGECADRQSSRITLPNKLPVAWGVQRLKNLTGSWRDQLLEILGAMGLREVRRLRGEMGRAMFMHELEADAFIEVEGYHA